MGNAAGLVFEVASEIVRMLVSYGLSADSPQGREALVRGGYVLSRGGDTADAVLTARTYLTAQTGLFPGDDDGPPLVEGPR